MIFRVRKASRIESLSSSEAFDIPDNIFGRFEFCFHTCHTEYPNTPAEHVRLSSALLKADEVHRRAYSLLKVLNVPNLSGALLANHFLFKI